MGASIHTTVNYKAAPFSGSDLPRKLSEAELYLALSEKQDKNSYQKFRDKFWKEYNLKKWFLFAEDVRPNKGEVLVRPLAEPDKPIWVNIFARHAYPQKQHMFQFLDDYLRSATFVLRRQYNNPTSDDQHSSRPGIVEIFEKAHWCYGGGKSFMEFVHSVKTR
jgi:hypothetical protein